MVRDDGISGSLSNSEMWDWCVCVGLPDTLKGPRKILVFSKIPSSPSFMCYYSIINNDTQVFAKLFFLLILKMVALGSWMDFGVHV